MRINWENSPQLREFLYPLKLFMPRNTHFSLAQITSGDPKTRANDGEISRLNRF